MTASHDYTRRFSIFAFAAVLLTTTMTTTHGVLLLEEQFIYDPGALQDNDGGVGWKSGSKWSNNQTPGTQVVSPGLSYTDSLGNVLDVAGNSISPNNANDSNVEDAVRDAFGDAIKSGTIWMSFLMKADPSGSNKVFVSMEEKYFMGQGSKNVSSSKWSLDDLADTNNILEDFDTPAIDSNTHFFVTRVEFNASGSNEEAWFWIDPNLDATPSDSDSLTGTAGEVIQDFDLTKISIGFDSSTNAMVDELRIGTSYADVSPFTITAIPEASAFLSMGCLALLAAARRR